MAAESLRSSRQQQVLSILGMAAIWPSIHNQVLYPLTFSFHKEGADSPYLYYVLYSVIMLVAVGALLFMNRRGIAQRLFGSKAAMAAFGLMGSLGISLLVVCDFGNNLARWFMGAGVAFSASFVPVYFIFWSIQLVYASKRRVAFDLVASYLVFCTVTLLRLAFGIHAWLFSILYPLASMALAMAVLACPMPGTFARGDTPLKLLPLNILIPTVAFVYLATAARLLLNPMSAASNYPPHSRLLIYVALIFIGIILAVLYRSRGKLRRNAELLAFALIAVILVGSILLTAVGLAANADLGNLPAITGINTAELFLWLVVLVNAQVKHAGVIKPAALFLVLVVGATQLATVLFLGEMEHLQLDTTQLPLMAITVGLAFLVVIVVMAVMAIMLYSAHTPSPGSYGATVADSILPASGAWTDASPRGGAVQPGANPLPVATVDGPDKRAPQPQNTAIVPPCVTMAADEAAIERIQESFGLSRRETDTLRLAARHKSAREIAEILFVAESTVNSHLKGIYRKCDVHSRTELTALVNRFKREQN